MLHLPDDDPARAWVGAILNSQRFRLSPLAALPSRLSALPLWLRPQAALRASAPSALRQNPQLSSMMVADSDGAEYLVLRDPLDPNVWSNRVVQADRWGTRVFNRKWNTATGEIEEGFGELEYDPRKRIWYKRALQTTDDEPVFWTKPVIFFVTKDPGFTASTHWVSDEETPRTIVVAYDLLLMDISKFTSRLKVSERGKAFVLVEDGDTGDFKVVGLPGDERYQSDASIRDALVFLPPESAIADSDAQLPPPDSLQVTSGPRPATARSRSAPSPAASTNCSAPTSRRGGSSPRRWESSTRPTAA